MIWTTLGLGQSIEASMSTLSLSQSLSYCCNHPTYMMYFGIGIACSQLKTDGECRWTVHTFDCDCRCCCIVDLFWRNLVATSGQIRLVGMTDGDILTTDQREGFLRSATDPHRATIWLPVLYICWYLRSLIICFTHSRFAGCVLYQRAAYDWFESSFGKISRLAEIEHSNLLCHCCLCGHSLVINADSVSPIVHENLEKKKDQAGGRCILSVWNQGDASNSGQINVFTSS